MVETQPGAVSRTGGAFKEGVDRKGWGAGHEEGENGGARMKMRKSNFRDDLFFQPAGILSSVSAKWSDDCQAKWGD